MRPITRRSAGIRSRRGSLRYRPVPARLRGSSHDYPDAPPRASLESILRILCKGFFCIALNTPISALMTATPRITNIDPVAHKELQQRGLPAERADQTSLAARNQAGLPFFCGNAFSPYRWRRADASVLLPALRGGIDICQGVVSLLIIRTVRFSCFHSFLPQALSEITLLSCH